jgi:hypothetical protein
MRNSRWREGGGGEPRHHEVVSYRQAGRPTDMMIHHLRILTNFDSDEIVVTFESRFALPEDLDESIVSYSGPLELGGDVAEGIIGALFVRLERSNDRRGGFPAEPA